MHDQSQKCIYLDHHATTPMDERVFQKMKPFFLSQFGNPSSKSHPFGWRAHDAIDEARALVARAINAHPTEIVFTSGATEATNMAIKGLFLPIAHSKARHIVTSSIEHSATLSTVNALKSIKVSNSLVAPTNDGRIDVDHVLNAMTDDTALITLFFVHNEIGSTNSIAQIGEETKKRRVLFHCDAAQALGRVKINCQELNVDMMSFSGHKAYGPKGVGCLYIKRAVMDRIAPLIHGGGQEWFKRSGTLNVPAIVGFGEAARLAYENFDEENNRIRVLRDRLLKNLKTLDGVHVNGSLDNRVSGNLNVSFEGIDGEKLLLLICNQVAISTGAACGATLNNKKHVLEEIGVKPELRQASIRFGLGRTTTPEDIEIASSLIVEQVKMLRARGNA